ncbi:hypothetical protein [Fibrivirga algicola]|uniref:Lipoprotein n=1 Tax=Fibrivirga algicola TaxID=2950420 RepID=A0ABX0QK93_9BACT|nr:hypothetical protein [Fibrivirga algicola]ARK12807.1 hypothetical protein A6C57_22095 [Fibrella sp. ES10-3-2-2]NID12880.1 hypothetical protein [Fibrivirga algicola]
MKTLAMCVLILFLTACGSEEVDNCIPYKAQLFGVGCGAMAVKVLNKQIESRIFVNQNVYEENVIEVLNLPDTLKTGEVFYFDFRNLQPSDNIRPCLAIYAGASRKVVLTKFSYSPCSTE